MPSFDSPNFKKTLPAQQSSFKEYTVGNPEDDENVDLSAFDDRAFVKQLEQVREEKQQSVNRITDTAKRRIELLAGLGRLTKDVMVDNITFSLRTLKAKEMREAMLSAIDVRTTIESGYEVRKQQLARSIFKIDNQDISMILGSPSLDVRLQFIDELEEVIVSKLFDAFTFLKDESAKRYGLNSDKDVKEVAEDIKK